MNSNKQTLQTGRISQVQRQQFQVQAMDHSFTCVLKGSFYKAEQQVPVIGDYVLFEPNSSGNSVICEIQSRTNTFKRPDQSGHAATHVKTMKEQILAANFDAVFIVASLNQNYNLNRITRYVTITIQSGATPVVILSKADLCQDKEQYIKQVQSISEQVHVLAISAHTGEGIDQLQDYLIPDSTILLIGSSGVGKSTLVNLLSQKDQMKVSQIREEDGRGHHTTTHRQLIMLPNNITLIDSPGLRELGMCQVEDGLEDTFSDILNLSSQCRFSNCRHQAEPGCQIIAAIQDGTLSQQRWEMYQKLEKENQWGNSKIKSPNK